MKLRFGAPRRTRSSALRTFVVFGAAVVFVCSHFLPAIAHASGMWNQQGVIQAFVDVMGIDLAEHPHRYSWTISLDRLLVDGQHQEGTQSIGQYPIALRWEQDRSRLWKASGSMDLIVPFFEAEKNNDLQDIGSGSPVTIVVALWTKKNQRHHGEPSNAQSLLARRLVNLRPQQPVATVALTVQPIERSEQYEAGEPRSIVVVLSAITIVLVVTLIGLVSLGVWSSHCEKVEGLLQEQTRQQEHARRQEHADEGRNEAHWMPHQDLLHDDNISPQPLCRPPRHQTPLSHQSSEYESDLSVLSRLFHEEPSSGEDISRGTYRPPRLQRFPRVTRFGQHTHPRQRQVRFLDEVLDEEESGGQNKNRLEESKLDESAPRFVSDSKPSPMGSLPRRRTLVADEAMMNSRSEDAAGKTMHETIRITPSTPLSQSQPLSYHSPLSEITGSWFDLLDQEEEDFSSSNHASLQTKLGETAGASLENEPPIKTAGIERFRRTRGHSNDKASEHAEEKAGSSMTGLGLHEKSSVLDLTETLRSEETQVHVDQVKQSERCEVGGDFLQMSTHEEHGEASPGLKKPPHNVGATTGAFLCEEDSILTNVTSKTEASEQLEATCASSDPKPSNPKEELNLKVQHCIEKSVPQTVGESGEAALKSPTEGVTNKAFALHGEPATERSQHNAIKEAPLIFERATNSIEGLSSKHDHLVEGANNPENRFCDAKAPIKQSDQSNADVPLRPSLPKTSNKAGPSRNEQPGNESEQPGATVLSNDPAYSARGQPKAMVYQKEPTSAHIPPCEAGTNTGLGLHDATSAMEHGKTIGHKESHQKEVKGIPLNFESTTAIERSSKVNNIEVEEMDNLGIRQSKAKAQTNESDQRRVVAALKSHGEVCSAVQQQSEIEDEENLAVSRSNSIHSGLEAAKHLGASVVSNDPASAKRSEPKARTKQREKLYLESPLRRAVDKDAVSMPSPARTSTWEESKNTGSVLQGGNSGTNHPNATEQEKSQKKVDTKSPPSHEIATPTEGSSSVHGILVARSHGPENRSSGANAQMSRKDQTSKGSEQLETNSVSSNEKPNAGDEALPTTESTLIERPKSGVLLQEGKDPENLINQAEHKMEPKACATLQEKGKKCRDKGAEQARKQLLGSKGRKKQHGKHGKRHARSHPVDSQSDRISTLGDASLTKEQRRKDRRSGKPNNDPPKQTNELQMSPGKHMDSSEGGLQHESTECAPSQPIGMTLKLPVQTDPSNHTQLRSSSASLSCALDRDIRAKGGKTQKKNGIPKGGRFPNGFHEGESSPQPSYNSTLPPHSDCSPTPETIAQLLPPTLGDDPGEMGPRTNTKNGVTPPTKPSAQEMSIFDFDSPQETDGEKKERDLAQREGELVPGKQSSPKQSNAKECGTPHESSDDDSVQYVKTLRLIGPMPDVPISASLQEAAAKLSDRKLWVFDVDEGKSIPPTITINKRKAKEQTPATSEKEPGRQGKKPRRELFPRAARKGKVPKSGKDIHAS